MSKSKKKTQKKTNTKGKNTSKKTKQESNKSLIEEIILFSCVGFSLLLAYAFLAENNGGFLGTLLNSFFTGLFGTGAFIIPIIITSLTIYYFLNPKNIALIKKRSLLILGTLIVTLVFMHTLTKNTIALDNSMEYFSFNFLKNKDPYIINGGLLGALIGNFFIAISGKFGTYIFIFISYAIIFVLFTNKSLAKILGTFGINTTKMGIDKTKEATDKFSQYTENIKQQKEVKTKLKTREKEIKLAEREIKLAEKEKNLSTFKKPTPNKELLDYLKKEPPKSVANNFIEKDLKNKSLKVPKKPNLFIIKEREQSKKSVTLIKDEVNYEEARTNNKIIETKKSMYFNNKPSVHTTNTSKENFNSNEVSHIAEEVTTSDTTNIKEPVTKEFYDVPPKTITPQQERVNAFYQEVKNTFAKSSYDKSISYNTSDNLETDDKEPIINDIEKSYISNNAINENIEEIFIDEENNKDFDIVVNDYQQDLEPYIENPDNLIKIYEANDINKKISKAVVTDNVIHGLFDYVDNSDENNDDIAIQELSYDFENDNNYYDDNDFDLIEELEKEEKIFDTLNETLKDTKTEINNESIENTNTLLNNDEDSIHSNIEIEKSDETPIKPINRFLPKEEEKTEEPKMEYDISDKGKLTLDKYEFPPIDILIPKDDVDNSLSDIEIQENSLKLEETLKSFGVKAKVVNVSRGPTVTRYEIEPGIGVKVSKIANLVDDLALSLASSGIRIQAPIPNKPYVGIEVPNKVTESVSLREVIDSEPFKNFKSKLAFGIGKDIGGETVIFDIGKMPHVLVAGATGSGKSVCVNTLITSIIYKARPDEVKLLMIDPKVVELSIYNGIPHLLIPVVTDPKKANSALNWAVREMERRYALFADNNVRNLDGYNDVAREKEYDEILPRIVVIIDELADLMMTAAKEVEDSICRLAQKARAAGIHLIIATQRPSVDVITGLIKANIPTRMAFAVSSGIDSRTIIDTVGAERLLGRGDMLFLPYGSNEPTRVQGAFVSDKEVENIVEYLSQYKAPKFSDEIINKITSTSSSDTQDDELDDLFHEIVDFIIQKQKASASMLQSKFRIGFNRASRIVDQLEERSFIGPTEGSKPRKVLITRNEWEEIRDNF